MSFGEQLRHARLDQGITLIRISDETRVPVWILESIECEDLSRVPGGIFIRGYLMSFARAVGLDGERLWADFRAELPSPTAEPAAVSQRAVPAIGPWTIVRVAAVVLVVAVVWRNIPRTNSDTAPAATPPPVQERTTDVVLAAATTAIPAAPVPAAPVPAAPVPKESKIVAAPAPAPVVIATPNLVIEPIAAADSNSVDQLVPLSADDAETNAAVDGESRPAEP